MAGHVAWEWAEHIQRQEDARMAPQPYENELERIVAALREKERLREIRKAISFLDATETLRTKEEE